MSRFMTKPTFCLCKNKGADQLHANCAADQCVCFRCIDSAIPLLPKSEISNFLRSSVFVSDLVGNPKTGFLMTQLIYHLDLEGDVTFTFLLYACYSSFHFDVVVVLGCADNS